VWGAASLLIAMAIYYPFAKAAERQRLRAEEDKAREPEPEKADIC